MPSKELSIEGVYMTSLPVFIDERGSVKEIFSNVGIYPEGHVYISTVNPGRVKGWHLHKFMDLNYACVSGMIKLVLYDSRPDSPTVGELDEVFIGDENYCMVHVPHGVVNGFKGLGANPSFVVNVASQNYSVDDIVRYPPHSEDVVPYDWKAKDG